MITEADLTPGCSVCLQRQHFLVQRALLAQDAVRCTEGRIPSAFTVPRCI